MHIQLLLNLSEMAFEGCIEQVNNGTWLLHNILHLLSYFELVLKLQGVSWIQEPEQINELIDVAGVWLEE